MQAVILAAGRGVRMRPLTDTTAKPLLSAAGRPLLDYTFDALPPKITEVIIVIGYLGEQIREYCGDLYKGRKISYIVQEKLEGTAKALWVARRLLENSFLVLMADDLYDQSDIQRCLEHERAILVIASKTAGPGGKVVLSEDGRLLDVEEGKAHPAGSLVSVGAYALTSDIFRYEPVQLADREGEWGLPQTVARMARDFPIAVVRATQWIKITTPEDLKSAETFLRQQQKADNKSPRRPSQPITYNP